MRENTWGSTCFPVSLKYLEMAERNHELPQAKEEREDNPKCNG